MIEVKNKINRVVGFINEAPKIIYWLLLSENIIFYSP